MIRATFDKSGIDSEFENNVKNSSKYKIPAGAYHQSNAYTPKYAEQEAKHFLKTIKPYKFYYPLALKFENELAKQKGATFISDIISAFANIIKSNGYYFALYKSFLDIKGISVENKTANDIWIEDLGSTNKFYPSYKNNVTIWKFSQKGIVPGINGNVGLNISYVDYPLIISKKGLNHLNNNIYENNNENSKSCEPTFYTVQRGDTLRQISQKTLGDPEKYKQIMQLNGLSNSNIYPGQTLRIPNCNNDSPLLHRVASGETLWSLAERYLGHGPKYTEIMAANGLTNDMIYPGQILKIPAENIKSENNSYTVKPGDTLWRIATTKLGNGNRYSEIIALNNLKNGNIRVGQVLKIPAK